jgi:pyridoxal 5'-phosphate synthase glutaminase subunit Pdx2
VKALVVGAGPAGTTAAIALARAGIEALVVERERTDRPVGIGLALQNSPLRALHALGLLDAVVERNAYGRQVDSFETLLDAPSFGGLVPGVFIRAPRFASLGRGVEALASRDGEPVLVREGRVWAATFHPELTTDPRVHRAFVDSVARTRAA